MRAARNLAKGRDWPRNNRCISLLEGHVAKGRDEILNFVRITWVTRGICPGIVSTRMVRVNYWCPEALVHPSQSLELKLSVLAPFKSKGSSFELSYLERVKRGTEQASNEVGK